MQGLPEGCISNILSFTSPLDACRSSVVSSTFKSATDSDIVWEKFLPLDYKDIISDSVSPFPNLSSKKEVYDRLCGDPILIGGGTKSINLEKRSGKKCYMIGARELWICWGDTPVYWRWKHDPHSRFAEVAELLNVCWFEIHGNIDTKMLSPKTTYAVYSVIKITEDEEDAYGLDDPPARVSINFVGGGGNVTSGDRDVFLNPECDRSAQLQFPREREDGWMEIEMGEFFNDEGEDGDVQIILKEIDGGHWKSGLIVQGFEIRPKGNNT